MTPEQRFKCMSHNRAKNTGPELKLRLALWRWGFRYRVNDKRLPGTPDIVLPKYHTVIFIHGCFWHGHRDCKFYTVPKTNTEFWTAKVARNQERDQEVWRQLEAKGWAVIIRNGELYRSAQEERRRSLEAYRQMRRQQREKEAALLAELKGR